MRPATAVALASILLFPVGSIAQDGSPAIVEAPQLPPVEQADPKLCEERAVTDSCVIALSVGAVIGVIALNSITGGMLTPILLFGSDGGIAAPSVLAGLFVAHWGVDLALIGSGTAAAVAGGATDPVTTVSDAYTTAETYVLSVGSDVSTAVGNWWNGR